MPLFVFASFLCATSGKLNNYSEREEAQFDKQDFRAYLSKRTVKDGSDDDTMIDWQRRWSSKVSPVYARSKLSEQTVS